MSVAEVGIGLIDITGHWVLEQKTNLVNDPCGAGAWSVVQYTLSIQQGPSGLTVIPAAVKLGGYGCLGYIVGQSLNKDIKSSDPQALSEVIAGQQYTFNHIGLIPAKAGPSAQHLARITVLDAKLQVRVEAPHWSDTTLTLVRAEGLQGQQVVSPVIGAKGAGMAKAPPMQQMPNSKSQLEQQLAELKKLREEGVLTEEEFASKKKQLIVIMSYDLH
eukprot:TRINITY_DN91900_c0_g1_i1.p1 TRINITY_DN91900_c0_g1~~TRINITY_DN91900_c0_g1_i1.p1  ORF type:complete len:232 (+),score=46.05 TRINITY_DN91900_c0_g1_i1:46-696(+)